MKDRISGTGRWPVTTSALDGTWDFLYLNLTNSGADATQPLPTASVLNVQSGSGENATGTRIVAYCFAEVPGFSKIGKYTGNAAADGPFVNCGFKPAYVMMKGYGSTQNWEIFDLTRTPSNLGSATGIKLEANLTNVEPGITGNNIDFLSNGFKIRTADWGINHPSAFIFIAFAANPFRYANAQ
jgi:hypothetical protein